MNLTSVKTIKELLLKYHARPSKTMGQNFLVDKPILSKIIETADLHSGETILEIGPGIGTLTKELAEKAGKVVAIEKDKAMVEILKETLEGCKNVEIIKGNALLTTNYSLPTKYKVVANIPYYITSPVIRQFLESPNPPEIMVLMVQKEVAQRICAKPPHMSILAVSVQFYAEAKIISYVSKGCFWPSPNVDSAIIKIVPQNDAKINPPAPRLWRAGAELREKKHSIDLFFKIVKAGFSQPRKQLANNLAKLFAQDNADNPPAGGNAESPRKANAWLLENNINPLQRAETLSIQDWINLTTSF